MSCYVDRRQLRVHIPEDVILLQPYCTSADSGVEDVETRCGHEEAASLRRPSPGSHDTREGDGAGRIDASDLEGVCDVKMSKAMGIFLKCTPAADGTKIPVRAAEEPGAAKVPGFAVLTPQLKWSLSLVPWTASVMPSSTESMLQESAEVDTSAKRVDSDSAPLPHAAPVIDGHVRERCSLVPRPSVASLGLVNRR